MLQPEAIALYPHRRLQLLKLDASVTGKLLPANRLAVTLIHAKHHTPMGPHRSMMYDGVVLKET